MHHEGGASAAATFAARIVGWQLANGRHDLPWQNTTDAYRIWLSEIMLQQTQVTTVLPYYARFVAAFPGVDALASAPLARVLELWSGLGYYRRAHHLHAAARAVVARHSGRFPCDAHTLTRLPGIGRSTAAAIAAFASGERRAILEGNVKRVLARHRGIEGWPGAPRVEAALWRVAESLLPAHAEAPAASARAAIGAYTQGMMDVGAMICTRARPRCEACPVRDDCIARRTGRIAVLPTPRPRRERPKRAVALLLLEREGRILLEQRPPTGVWAGLWSLPEAPLDADVAGHAMRFGAVCGAPRPMPVVTHAFTHFELTMHPLRLPVVGTPNSASSSEVDWLEPEAALARALPSPIRRLLQSIAAASKTATKRGPSVSAAADRPTRARRRAVAPRHR